jgi:hypothetical protein
MRARGLVMLAVWTVACGGKQGGGVSDASGGEPSVQDPEDAEQPPAAQGAVAYSLKALSPVPPGKSCPTSSFTAELPANGGLDGDTYLSKVVDGEGAASVMCRVSGTSTFELSGEVRALGRGLLIQGELGADRRGVGQITITDSEHLSGSLTGTSCTLDAQQGDGNNFQINTGLVWGGFSCATVEAAPSTACGASGYFVLENCEQ